MVLYYPLPGKTRLLGGQLNVTLTAGELVEAIHLPRLLLFSGGGFEPNIADKPP